MKKLWQNYNLSIVLFILFMVAWIVQTYTGWHEFMSEQQQHGQVPQVFGSDGYIWRWGEATFENWQSEFLQLFSMVVLTSFLIHKGSAESRDSQDEMQQQLNRIEKQLKELRSAQTETVGNGKAREVGAKERS
jgi:hypothetical protein